jgi:hypothetical protein
MQKSTWFWKWLPLEQQIAIVEDDITLVVSFNYVHQFWELNQESKYKSVQARQAPTEIEVYTVVFLNGMHSRFNMSYTTNTRSC